MFTNSGTSHASKNQSEALLRRGSKVRILPRSPLHAVTATCSGSAKIDHNLSVPLAANSAVSGGVRLNRYAVGENLAVLFCPASNGKLFGVTVDTADLPAVLEFGFWRVANFYAGKGGFALYAYASSHSKIVYLHRLLLSPPAGAIVDHIHHRTLDNRRSQLRSVNGSVSQRNRRNCTVPNRLGLRGVCKTRSGSYQARVWENKKAKYLGFFPTPKQAAEAVRQYLAANGGPSLIPNQQAGQQ